MELMAWKQGSWQRNGAQGCDHLAPGMILNRLSTFKLTEARRFNLQLPGYISPSQWIPMASFPQDATTDQRR